MVSEIFKSRCVATYQMAENASRLNFYWSHFSDGLNMKPVIGKLVSNVIIVSDYDDLHDNLLMKRFEKHFLNQNYLVTIYIRFLLRSKTSVERI